MNATPARQVELLGRLDELMRVFVDELGHDAALYNFRAVAERIRKSGFVPGPAQLDVGPIAHAIPELPLSAGKVAA